jgi:hypothetical protein
LIGLEATSGEAPVRALPVDLSGVVPRRSETWDRLAHRVAAFFGADVDGSPAGRTWVMNYDAVTAAEIARGGPLPSREWHAAQHPEVKPPLGDSPLVPRDTWWIAGRGLVRGTGQQDLPARGDDLVQVMEGVHEIAPATTGRFGPDRKAALVLAGSNELFAGLVPVFREVVAAIAGTQPSLHRRVRLALWAALVQEAYRSQPALFAAAVQARAIQRALSLPWQPVAGLDLPMARGEYGSPDASSPQADPDLRPRILHVLDTTLDELGIDLAPGVAEVNEAYLRQDVIARWTNHLLESPDRGVVWLTESEPGKRQAEVLLATVGPVLSLVTEAFGQLDEDEVADAEGRSRFCPTVPTPAEAARLSERGRPVLIWALVQLHRLLRQDPAFDDREFLRHVTRQLHAIAELSAELLGPVHPMTYFARNRHAIAEQRDLREDDDAAAREAGTRVRETVVRLGELRRAGLVSGGFYTEVLVSSAPAVRLSMVDARAHRDDLAAEIEEDLHWLWGEVFTTIGVDLAAEVERADAQNLSPLLAALAPYVHNYTAFLAETGGREGKARALRLLEDVVIPARAALAKQRGTEQPLRLSLQVVIDRIDDYLESGGVSPADREHWSQRAWEHTKRLTAMPYVQQVLASHGELVEARKAALTRVVTGWVIALEAGTNGSAVSLDDARAQLDRLAGLRGVALAEGPQTGLSVNQTRVLRLHERLAAVQAKAAAPRVLARSRMSSSATATGREVAHGGPAGWVVPLPDADVFTALRGAPPRRSDPWPILEVTWTEEAGGSLHIALEQPILSPHVASVAVRLEAGDSVHEMPLTWQIRPGHPVRLEGAVTEVPRPALSDVGIEVAVRGRAG